MRKKTWIKILCTIICFVMLGMPIFVQATELEGNETTDTTETPSEKEEVEYEPIILNVTRYTTTRRTFDWESNSEENVYKLLRSMKKDGVYEEITQISGKKGTIEHVVKDLELGKTYYYKVEQIVDGEAVATSNIVTIIIRLLPVENIKLTMTNDNDVTLNWDKVPYASGYYISRCTKIAGQYKRVGTVNASTCKFTDKTPASGKTYYYKVRAYRKNNASALCKMYQCTAVTCHTKPAKPVVTGSYTTSKKVKLSWKAVSGATYYNIFKRNSAGKYVKVDVTQNKYYYDSDVKANKTYKYKVSAYYKTNNKTIIGKQSAICSVFTSKIDPKKKMVALTFDDGPGPYTQAIVNCLKKNNAHATFFVVGNRVNSYKSALKSAYDNGNEIANHTYSHPTLTTLSVSSMKSQISKTDTLVKNITGKKTVLVRAPGGATNSTVRNNIAKPFIYWSIDTRDWETRSKSATINSVMNNVRDGDIILMHDIHYPTKEAALEIIPRLKKAGYQLVTVSEMAAARGYDLKNGTTYYSFR